MSTPQMHAGLRAAFLALTAAFSVAVCAVEHGSVGLCLFVGLLGGLFGGELIAAKLEKPVCKSIERRRQRAEVYPNFLRWRSAVEAYEAFHRAVIAEEQRVLEEKRRSEEEEERRRDEERREREEAKRRQVEKREEAKRRQVEWWKTLDGWKFEKEMAALLQRRGYGVRKTGKPGDSGVDLVLVCGSQKIIVQCKAHGAPVGPGAIRDLYGTMLDQQVHESWLISTNRFTKGAYAFSKGKPITLLTIEQVLFGKLGCREVP